MHQASASKVLLPFQERIAGLAEAQVSTEEAREQAALEAEQAAAQRKRHEAAERAAKAKTWSEEEVRLLEKALIRFPQACSPAHP